MESLKGRLLLAGGALFDPNFRRTVILVADHDEDGAAGVVLNRRADVTVGVAAPSLTSLVPAGELLYVGGPVQPQAAVVLVEFERPDLVDRLVFGSVGLLSGDEAGETLDAMRRARVYAGYAGWGPGQLDAEVEEGSWLVEDPTPEDVFTEDPDRLWSAVVRRKGRGFSMLALMPDDPSLN